VSAAHVARNRRRGDGKDDDEEVLKRRVSHSFREAVEAI
jgi:hypothetical protein